MAGNRTIETALRWLDGEDGDAADEPPPQSNKRAPRRDRVAPTAFRHDRKCSVCRHPQRDEIERDFLHWRSPESIAKEYGIAHHSSIYRHVRATNLFAKRATTIKLALSPIIEQAMVVPVTADSVVRAVVAFAHLNDCGEWVEPPRRVIHESANRTQSETSPGEDEAKVNRELESNRT